MADEPTAPVAANLGPSAPDATASGRLPMTAEQVTQWRTRIKKAIEQQRKYHGWWDAALDNYAPKVSESPEDYGLKVRTNRAFTIVERKEADLFYQRPDVSVTPTPLLEMMPNGSAMASAHGTIVNHKLGTETVNAKQLAREAIFAYELFGAGPTYLGYRRWTTEAVTQVPLRDETGARVVDPMTGQFTMTTEVVPVPLKSECFWENLSPRQFLSPRNFRSTQFDRAPWLGHRFEVSKRDAQRLGWDIPKEFTPGSSSRTSDDDSIYFDHGDGDGTLEDAMLRGTMIYFRSVVYRDDIDHPDHLTKLVLIDGLPEPVEYRDDPDQELNDQGLLTADSRIGYPYQVLTIRSLTDSSRVMSDVAVALPLTKELDKFRQQMVRQRDINLLRFVYNAEKAPEGALTKIVMAPQGGMIGLPDEAFSDPNGPIRPLPHQSYPPDNFAIADRLDNDLARTFAVDAASAGTSEVSGDLTATEVNVRQANANTRLGWEQGVVADWYVAGVTKLSSLLQRYLDVEEVQAIVGPDAAQQWDAWRKQIPVRLAFTMMPDSSLRNDTPLDRKQTMELFTYAAKDPTINRRYMWMRILPKWHIDPSKALVPQDQMPQPKPEPPNLSLAIKGDDLSPASPQAPVVLELLRAAGVEIAPEVLQAAENNAAQFGLTLQFPIGGAGRPGGAQPAHPGKQPRAENLDKHQTDRTFAMQRTGVASAGGPGG